MELIKQVVYALVGGVSRALPISASGQRVAASVWLGEAEAGAAIVELAQIGCFLALVVVVRRRLGRAFAEGIRGLARPTARHGQSGARDAIAMAIGAGVAVVTEMALSPLLSRLNDTPIVAAVGLSLTAAGLLSTAVAPAPHHFAPSASGAVWVGLAHGFASAPGASRVGAAFVVLSWLGVTRWRAAEMAILVSLPSLALGALYALSEPARAGGATFGAGEIALIVTVAFVGASIAATWWKALAERGRSPWLGAWLLPLALALVAYGRALPHPTEQLPLPEAHAPS